MRVGILQFAPTVGEPERNRARADELLAAAGYGESMATEHAVDLLALPEMAFSGYNFPSLDAIEPFLEPTAAGPSARWAARTARRLGCLVAVGYPETTCDPAAVPAAVSLVEVPTIVIEKPADAAGADAAPLPLSELPALPDSPISAGPPQNFNALLVVGPDGTVHAHYRKTHLYYTDATWAAPSPEGFHTASLPLPHPFPAAASPTKPTAASLSGPVPAFSQPLPTPSPSPRTAYFADTAPPGLKTAFAICMDLNPQYFTAPVANYEAANFALQAQAPLLLGGMAWLGGEAPAPPAVEGDDDADTAEIPDEPDWVTLTCWVERLRPLLEQGLPEADVPLDTTNLPPAVAAALNAPTETLVVLANRAGVEPGLCIAHELDPQIRAANAVVAAERAAAAEAAAAAAAAGTDASADDAANAEPRSPSPAERESSGVDGIPFALEARYAGSSAVLALGGGRARVFGVLGRTTEGVLRVDTTAPERTVWRLAERKRGSSRGSSRMGSQTNSRASSAAPDAQRTAPSPITC